MFVAILVLVAMTFIEHRAKGRIAEASQSYPPNPVPPGRRTDRIRRIGRQQFLRRHSGSRRGRRLQKV